jgi:hypothetical protein
MDLNMKHVLISFLVLALSGCSGISAVSQTPSDEEILSAKTINSPVAISAVFGHKNSASGIDIYITYQNIGNKPIKHASFNVVLVDSIGEFVTTSIRRNKVTRLKDTGPIKPGSTGWAKWKTAVYHPTASRLAIRSLIIEYMDGSIVENTSTLKMPSAIGVIEDKI